MALHELLGNERIAEMLSIDESAATRFQQMTPTEQLYVGAYAVAVAKKGSWLVSEEMGDNDFFGSDLVLLQDLDKRLRGPANKLRKTIAEIRLEFAESNFQRLAEEIFARNVMVLNGFGRTALLDARTGEHLDNSMEEIIFRDREFVQIIPGKRTHEESTLTVVRARNLLYPHFGSKFYATYHAYRGFERFWMNEQSDGCYASIPIDTHPKHFMPNPMPDPFVWRVDRPLHIPRQRSARI